MEEDDVTEALIASSRLKGDPWVRVPSRVQFENSVCLLPLLSTVGLVIRASFRNDDRCTYQVAEYNLARIICFCIAPCRD